MQFSQILAFQCKCLIMQYIDTYKFPFLYFDLGHMFDGVPATDSRVHDTEPPLPQHWTNLEKRSDIWTFFVVWDFSYSFFNKVMFRVFIICVCMIFNVNLCFAVAVWWSAISWSYDIMFWPLKQNVWPLVTLAELSIALLRSIGGGVLIGIKWKIRSRTFIWSPT